MQIVNLTPHVLSILDESGEQVAEIQPSGSVARIATERVKTSEVNGVPLFTTELGEPEGLPDPQPNTIYVVSGMFRVGHDRADLYQPGELVRDDDGQPVGCIGLSR